MFSSASFPLRMFLNGTFIIIFFFFDNSISSCMAYGSGMPTAVNLLHATHFRLKTNSSQIMMLKKSFAICHLPSLHSLYVYFVLGDANGTFHLF